MGDLVCKLVAERVIYKDATHLKIAEKITLANESIDLLMIVI